MKIYSMCHVVLNERGAIYEMGEDMKMWVTLRQRVVQIQGCERITDIREVKWETDFINLRENSCVPGNILQEVQTEPIDLQDTEIGLFWVQVGRREKVSKVMRDEHNRALYRYLRYDISSTYKLYGEEKESVSV